MRLIYPDWPAAPHIKAFTTTRCGGYSDIPYASWNLAHHVGDDPDSVKQNREKLLTQLPQEPIWLEQIHSHHVIEAGDKQRYQKADGAFSTTPQTVCCVMTADCLPVLLCDKSGTMVASIHGGWRGLAQGIIAAAVNNLPTNTNNLMAWLGPAIGPKHFAVGLEVKQQFVQLDPSLEVAFQPYQDRWLADIYHIARQQLQQLGVQAVFGGHHCTYAEDELFYSYRRDGQTGRMASLIWIDTHQ